MRSFLRKAGLILATGSLVFFLSCERHHVGELHGDETGSGAEEHKSHAKETPSESERSTATTNRSHTSQTPEPRNSPANFFPDKPKP